MQYLQESNPLSAYCLSLRLVCFLWVCCVRQLSNVPSSWIWPGYIYRWVSCWWPLRSQLSWCTSLPPTHTHTLARPIPHTASHAAGCWTHYVDTLQPHLLGSPSGHVCQVMSLTKGNVWDISCLRSLRGWPRQMPSWWLVLIWDCLT